MERFNGGCLNQRGSNCGVSVNEVMVKTSKTEEASQSFDGPWFRPLSYGRDLQSNGFHAPVRDQMAQILHLRLGKETLRKFKNKVVLEKHLENGL